MRKMILFFILIFLTACNLNSNTDKIEINISAASSLNEALEEVKVEFEKQYPQIQIFYNFGSSGTLQQQIIQGAPIDLFISASKEKFGQLQDRNLVSSENSVEILQNSLVLIGRENAVIDTFQELEIQEIESIAIGIPETVPAGKYAKETLKSIGIWELVEPKVIYGKDVRQVLSYVETGNVELGIVYLTDAMISEKVRVLATADEKWHSSINYSLGVINHTKHVEEATTFYKFLQERQAIEIFEKYGFKGLEKKNDG